MNLDEGKIYISKLNLNREKGEIESPHKPVLQYATPVFDSENQKRGVFVLSVRADYLIKNILTHKFNRGLDSYFLDKEGFYLLHSDVSKRWGGSDDLNTGENLNNDFPQESASLILSGKPGIILIDEHLFNYVPIYFDPSNVERYWIYMESLDESTIYSPIYAFYKIFGVLIFVLITSGVMATLFFSRSLTRPLSKLVEGASRISEGDFSYRIKVKSSDEIGCLTNTFNGMTLRLEEAERKLRDHAVNLEKKVEEKTEEIIRKEYTENLIETAQDAIICIDENWIINIWNQMAEKIFRYSKGEIVGKSIHTIIPERYMKEQEEDVSLLLKTDVYRKTWKILKMSAINRTGQVIPIEMSLACNKAEKDKLSFTFIIRDITDRNRMEEMLLRSEKLKALGVMTSGISHEFNNILAIIRGNAILIEKGYSDHPKLMEKLNVIIEKSGAGAEVVRRMQDFADKEKDTAIIPVDIRDITIQAINFTTPSWKNIALSNGIKYDIEQKDLKPVPTVLGNPTELKDVLLNMINNAMQAMPGGGRLSFRTWSEDNTVYLSISDTGVGMSKDLQ
ncbi:MAG: PAS domain S-box protein, partial [Thermodesulfobacteriota bacterium]